MDDENGEMMALGVGSVDGRPRKECMATLHSLAMETLTRSSTHQGQQMQPYPDTAETQSQPAQRAVLDTIDRHLTPSSSRPVSQHQEQAAPSMLEDASTVIKPSQPIIPNAVDRNTTYPSAHPFSQNQNQQAPSVPTTTETQNLSQSQPAQSAISNVTDQKPTLLSYRPDSQHQQSNEKLLQNTPNQPNFHDNGPTFAQPTPPSQPTSPPSQPAASPVLTQSPAPLADRLHPHFNASHTELANPLKSISPRGQSESGGKPKDIQMPQRPVALERTETVFYDAPSEIPKQFP
jgi:hypothetical protein